MKIQLVQLIVLVSAASFAFHANGQSLPNGLEIAKKTHQVNEGITLSRKLVMELTDKRGKTRVRETISYRKYFGKEKRLAIFYETPTNVKGTAFLVYDYPDASLDDDQWLYMPALRKTRRISAANRGDYFLGTDLTYEDIKLEAKANIEDFNYKTIGTEQVDGQACYVIVGTPIDDKVKKELGYSKIQYFIDKKINMVRRFDSWDEAGNALKTVQLQDIKQVQGIWTYHRLHVKNNKTSHETVFKFSLLDYKTPIDDAFFTEQALVRGI